MCGINGFNFANRELIDKMNAATHHRGPDGTGVFSDAKISLGHNLLAITELPQNSHQPFVSSDKRFALLFNGEIYNYVALRAELQQAGDIFKTNSDTEVIFFGLMRYGKSFLDKLDGMFAIAFYDAQTETLLVSRDSSGIKPLYYFYDGKQFIFSSELRSIFSHNTISRRLDMEALNTYFILGYVPSPKTLFQSIQKVCPGQYLDLNLRTGTLEKGWLNLEPRTVPGLTFSPQSLRSVIADSVSHHTQGLRPLGLYLSGGLDSSALYYELFQLRGKDLRTYTTRFDVGNAYFNGDADIAKRLTKDFGSEHHELLVTEKSFIGAIEDVIACIEEPRWNPHITQQWLLAKEASQKEVVILNGSGGDELFLGYQKHFNSRKIREIYDRYPHIVADVLYTMHAVRRGRVDGFKWLPLHDLVYRWVYVNNVWFNLPKNIFTFSTAGDIADVSKYLRSVGHPAVQKPLADPENVLGDFDRLFWLADEEFMRTDKIAMHYGMEGRFPLLGREVQRYANSIPSAEKIVGSVSKRLMRDTYGGLLPEYVTNKEKTGWKSPATEWMRSELGDMVRSVLSPSYYSVTAPLFNLDLVRSTYANKSSYTISDLKIFFPIFAFQIWAKHFKVEL